MCINHIIPVSIYLGRINTLGELGAHKHTVQSCTGPGFSLCSKSSQGKTCFHYRELLLSLQESCICYRDFSVRITTQEDPCSHYREWVCSAGWWIICKIWPYLLKVSRSWNKIVKPQLLPKETKGTQNTTLSTFCLFLGEVTAEISKKLLGMFFCGLCQMVPGVHSPRWLNSCAWSFWSKMKIYVAQTTIIERQSRE